MIKRIRAIVRQLDAPDWHTRDAAQSQLVSIGPPVMSVLRQLRPDTPTEAAQRIDLVLDRLTADLNKNTAPSSIDDGATIPILR
jgi:hypothetical protein